jgi:hypothetical protein
MNRVVSALKQFAELYLLIVGGAYTLSALVALVLNARTLFQTADPGEVRTIRTDLLENWLMFIPAALILLAGIGVRGYRWWGLVLAAGMGILAVGHGLQWELTHPGIWDYHDFTIVLPMAAILVWAILPPTWLEFKRQSLRAS